MATPLVAGVTAQLLSRHPDWQPNQVYQALLDASVEGVITNALQPNLLLQNNFQGIEGVAASPWVVEERNPNVIQEMIVRRGIIMASIMLIPAWTLCFSCVRVWRLKRDVGSYTGLDMPEDSW